MKCSLILATLGRDAELVDLFRSLTQQTHQDFELIVIDQNRDGRIDPVIEQFRPRFPIRHIKVDFTGNARARDYGVQFASGSIVTFPNDDCVYEFDVLDRVIDGFRQQAGLGVLVAGSYDFGKRDFSIGVNAAAPRHFSRLRMMGGEFTHFFNLNVIDRRDFHLDHDFGIGSKYAGAEGFELLYRVLRAGSCAYYDPAIMVYHANKDVDEIGSERMLTHSSGVGAFIRKFANEWDPAMAYYMLREMFIAPVLKLLLAACALNRRRWMYSYNNLIGIWQGFFAYRKPAG